MVTQQVTGAARLKLMTSSLVDMSLLPLHPQSDSFNSAFCKGNRVTLQPAKIQTAQNFGNLFGLAESLAAILFSCEFFSPPPLFFSFKAPEGFSFPVSPNRKIKLLVKEFEVLDPYCVSLNQPTHPGPQFPPL